MPASVSPESHDGSGGQPLMRTNSMLVKEKESLSTKILSNKYFNWTVSGLTGWALFADDFRVMLTDKPADSFFYAIAIICLIVFVLELALNFYSRTDWRFGFYFWLDFLATLSLIPDIGWIWSPISEALIGGDSGNQEQAIAAGKPARAGTKTGRVVRIVRLVRMVRMVKLYKMNGGDDEDTRMQRLKKLSVIIFLLPRSEYFEWLKYHYMLILCT